MIRRNKSLIFVTVLKTNIDKKMKASFTTAEKLMLRGQPKNLAKKYDCSREYVNMIINGKREINFPLAKKIYKDLNSIIKLLSPITPE